MWPFLSNSPKATWNALPLINYILYGFYLASMWTHTAT